MVGSIVLALLLSLTAAAQGTGTLRITVVLTDADGTATPIPRVPLLISDNPSTTAPRLVRTGPDGTIDVALRPGSYTVESDQPIVLRGQAYVWTQMIDVTAGGKAVLALSATNAEIESAPAVDSGAPSASAPVMADSAAVFNKWRSSVVEIWTPTSHASGFLIHEKGLIATDYRAIGETTPNVSVQLDRVKVAGRVVAADRLQGVAVIWIDPKVVASLRPLPLGCDDAAGEPAQYDDRIFTIAAPMLAPVDRVVGTVGRVQSQVIEVDWHLGRGSAGGPVLTSDGRAIGITIADEETPRGGRPSESRVIPIANACSVLAAAEKKITGAAPPPANHLPVEAAVNPAEAPKGSPPKAARPQVTTLSSSSFDISLTTPEIALNGPSMTASADFGNWAEYVATAPPVVLVRVTPQFEESLWKTIARGAASTQGVALPPLKSFSANFNRMRAYCDNKEVAPIQPFVIERRVSETAAIREGLYVFGLTDFNTCSAVRLDLYSEKSGNKPDSRTVNPKLFAQIGNPPPK